MRLDVGRVEPALEADLDDGPGGLRAVDERDGLREVERERLLDEHRQPASIAWLTSVAWALVDAATSTASARAQRLVDGRGDPPADQRRRLGRAAGIDVVDDDLVDPGLRRHQASVQPADPAGAEERDPHLVLQLLCAGRPDQPARTSGLGRTMSRTTPWRSW